MGIYRILTILLSRNTCVTIIMFASAIFDPCSATIKLCPNKINTSQNMTSVVTKLGQAVSISFCVESDTTVHDYVYIERPPQYVSVWYPKHGQNNEDIQVVITHFDYKATINITIRNPQDQDFGSVFHVIVFRKPLDYINKVTFMFELKHKGDIINEKDRTPTFQQETSKPTFVTISSDPSSQSSSSTTTQATSARPSKTTPTTQVTTTAVEPRCQSQTNSGCPTMWYPVDEHMCLMVHTYTWNVRPEDRCASFGAQLSYKSNIDNMQPCLLYLLQNYTNKIIALKELNLNVSTWTKITRHQQPYRVACLLDKRHLAYPAIESFFMRYQSSTGTDKTQHFLNITLSYVKIENESGSVYVTCNASGYPQPEVTISHNNVSLTRNHNGQATLRDAGCDKSGIYSCLAKNVFRSAQTEMRIQFLRPIKIDEFTIKPKQTRKSTINTGDDVKVRCSVTGCAETVILTIYKDTNNKSMYTATNNSIVKELHNITCGDMGRYYCRSEDERGNKHEKTFDLLLDRCQVQLCRGENSSKVISAALKEDVNFNVCLISNHALSWEIVPQTNQISVNITSREASSPFYFTAKVSIAISEGIDYGTRTIRLKNQYGSLDYQITINGKGQSTLSSSHQQIGTIGQTDLLLIVVPLAVLVLIVTVIITVMVYRNREILQERLRSMKTRNSASDDSGQGIYANLKQLDVRGATKDRPVGFEQESFIETRLENEIPIDITDQDDGRIVSDEGLVYLTVAHVAKIKSKVPKPNKSKIKEAISDNEEQVEYTTLDFEKTGKVVMPDEPESKPEEQVGDTGIKDRQ